MGNPRLVHYACALAASTLLTGCDIPHAWRESEIDEKIADRTFLNTQHDIEQSAKIADLERKVAHLEGDIAALELAHDKLIGTVNKNAEVNNSNAIKDMTRRGACGTDLVQTAPGVFYNQPRKCTKADLAP